MRIEFFEPFFDHRVKIMVRIVLAVHNAVLLISFTNIEQRKSEPTKARFLGFSTKRKEAKEKYG